MAVDVEHRSAGVGRRLLELIEQVVEKSPAQLMWCNARVPAIGFYQRMGWTVVSEEFEVPTAGPHKRMIKQL